MHRQLLRRLRIASNSCIIAQHKPFSLLSPSSNPRGNKRYARDLLTEGNRHGGTWKRAEDPRDLVGLECAGRLDADSTGLLLWTNDRSLLQHVIGPTTPVDKEYIVRVSGHVDWSPAQKKEVLRLLRSGMSLDGRPLLPAGVEWLNDHQLRIVLREGRHRQIRRMLDIVGLQVEALKRVRIGQLRLQGLSAGCWKPISPASAASLLIRQRGPEKKRPQRHTTDAYCVGALRFSGR